MRPLMARRRRLDTVTSLRRETLRLYAEARAGELDPDVAVTLSKLLAQAARLLEGVELERRIEALEQAAGGDVVALARRRR
jgi:hypothetical protein